MMSSDLKFDKMDVDTTLAMQYLKANSEVHGIGTKDSLNYVFDSARNKIFLTKPNSEPSYGCSLKKKSYFSSLWELSEKIKCNIDLFCQLEYVIRRRSPYATKLDLEMMIKNLRNTDFALSCWTSSTSRRLAMNNDSPLIDLGWIAELPVGEIVATADTAVVCNLFTKLCIECGLAITLRLVNSPNAHESFTSIKNKKALRGCIGVVTAKSDVASAVDIILSAPKSDVWGIRRILVQESARDTFNQSMSWKAKPNASCDTLMRSCSDVYTHDDKVYAHEYIKADNPENVILIECFRTVKEAIGMLEDYSPFCVSLWSSDVAESNEIAIGITAPLVWINGYGSIGEPAKVSEAYYSYFPEPETPEVEELRKLQKSWANLTRETRIKKFCRVYQEGDNAGLNRSLVSSEPSDKNFVHVSSSSIVTGIRILRDIGVFRLGENNGIVRNVREILIEGSGCLVILTEPHSIDENVKALLTSDIPVRELRGLYPGMPCYKRRIIHTSFGTIFAN